MEKLSLLRSVYRSACSKSARFTAINDQQQLSHTFRYLASSPSSFRRLSHRSFFSLSPKSFADSPKLGSSDHRPPFAAGIGSIRRYSDDVTHLPVITDPEIENVFKDLMASSWDELPDPVIKDAKKALSKNTSDTAGQEALKNVFRAAEAVEEFGGVLVQLRMAIDDSIGMSGENVKPLSDEFASALREAHTRYTAYLDAFGPDETYLRKKVETELGTKMIHLKMRCSSLGSDWGKVTVLGTSGLSGSYVEQRAP